MHAALSATCSASAAAPAPLRGISSMATKRLLGEMLALWHAQGGTPVQIESVGGVDAARRVQAGEAFDLVFLADDALTKLGQSGCLRPGSQRALALSLVAAAVPQGAAAVEIGDEQRLRQAIAAAPSIGYSTGPSGVALQALFAHWGVSEAVAAKTVQAPPGVPVGELVAQGKVALGFQQLSELMHVPGITLLGLLPESVAIRTVFSGAIGQACTQTEQAEQLLAFMAGPQTAALKQREGMAPAP